MFNLLPKAEKDKILREYRIRLAVVVLWFIFATFILASVSVFPSYVLSSDKVKSAQRRFDTLSESVSHGRNADLDAVLADAKMQLSLLSHEPPKAFLHELMLRIVSLKTDGISLSSLSFTGVGKKGEASIIGIAADRNALLAFSKELERAQIFEKVEVPPSNFAKNAGIEFSIRVIGGF